MLVLAGILLYQGGVQWVTLTITGSVLLSFPDFCCSNQWLTRASTTKFAGSSDLVMNNVTVDLVHY